MLSRYVVILGLLAKSGRVGVGRHTVDERDRAKSTSQDRSAIIASPVSDQPIADALVEDVYAELRRLADRYVRRERAQSVQATELVHEAYLRIARDKPVAFADRGHFIGIAAIAMRRLLVERARRRGAAKRFGGQVQVTLDEGLLADDATSSRIDLIALDRALTRLAALDAQQARIVELRYFGGLSVEETGEVLGISAATVKRHWAVARAWLLREIEGAPSS
jgi:RNA polymerase sigma factor (TIGR02999 family)